MITISSFIAKMKFRGVLELFFYSVLIFTVFGAALILLVLGILVIQPDIYLKPVIIAMFATDVLMTLIFAWYMFNRYIIQTVPLISLIQEQYPHLHDDLLSGYELSSDAALNTSAQLRDKFIVSLEARLMNEKFRGFDLIKIYKKLVLILCSIVLVLNAAIFLFCNEYYSANISRVFNVFNASGWENYFKVLPGDMILPYSSGVMIQVDPVVPLHGKPFVHFENFQKKPSKAEMKLAGSSYQFFMDQLSFETEYFITWQDIRSKKFKITPVIPAQLGDFKVRYTYPKYALLPPFVSPDPNISCLRGSMVEVEASANKDVISAIVSATWPENIKTLCKGKTVRFSFVAVNNGKYMVKLRPKDNTGAAEAQSFDVRILRDMLPQAEILSPTDELFALGDELLPIVIQAGDDYGVTKLALIYRIDNGAEKEIIIDSDFKQSSFINEYSWDLSRLDITRQAGIEYYARVWDNDVVSGPKYADSRRMSLRIKDYEQIHSNLSDDINKLKDSLVSLLANETMLASQIKEFEQNFSTAQYRDALRTKEKDASSVADSVKSLDNILSQMQKDPYTELITMKEFEGIQAHLENLAEKSFPETISSLKSGDMKASANRQNKTVSELEKIVILMENLWKYQNMKNVVDTADTLAKKADNLLDKITSSADKESLQKAMQEIDSLLDELEKRVSQLQQELPDEFVNSKAVKDVNTAQKRDMLEELQKALAEGNAEKAKELAGKLRDALSKMLSDLSGTSDNIDFAGSMAEKDKEISKYEKQLEEIISGQSSVLRGLEKENAKYMDNLFAWQEKYLNKIQAEQNEFTVQLDQLTSEILTQRPGYRLKDERISSLNNKILDEIKNRRLHNSQKYLEDMATSLSEKKQFFSINLRNDALVEDVNALINTEKRILEALKFNSAPELQFSSGDISRFAELSVSEKKLSQRSKALRQDMEAFLRRSSSLLPESLNNIDISAVKMLNASSSLDANKIPDACTNAQEALELLLKAQDSLSESAKGLESQKEGKGKKSAGSIQSASGRSLGFKEGRVKLPDSKDFKVPMQFRQGLLEALKERYPQKYEKAIKDYFRRLAE